MRGIKRKSYILPIFALVVVILSVGYAAITATLNITGTSTITKNTWNIHFQGLSVTSGSVTAATPAAITTNNHAIITYTVTLPKPGDFYEFTVNIVNDGTIAAKTSAAPTLSGNTQSTVMTYTATWSDGTAIAANTTLAAGASKEMKLRVQYRKDITSSQLPTEDKTLTLKFSLPIVQA